MTRNVQCMHFLSTIKPQLVTKEKPCEYSTRVREPTKDNYLKLTRVIRSLCATVYLPLIIGWDESGTLLWSIDTSFAVHNDMRSHTGAMLTFGRGTVFLLSNKQKVNSTSSTVA